MRRSKNCTVILSVLVLLAGAIPLAASAFCFSFGSKAHDRAPYGAYLPPYPGVAAPMYPVYGYSPVPPAYNYNNPYYPLPPSYVATPPGAIKK